LFWGFGIGGYLFVGTRLIFGIFHVIRGAWVFFPAVVLRPLEIIILSPERHIKNGFFDDDLSNRIDRIYIWACFFLINVEAMKAINGRGTINSGLVYNRHWPYLVA